MMKNTVKFFLGLSVFALVSCDNDDDDDNPPTNPTPTASMITMDIDNLESLPDNERYEGWLIVDGNPVSTGLFQVDGNGQPSQTSFNVSESDRANATAYVLSIEPFPDNDPAPSDIKILGGAFAGNTASVSVDHPAALNASFDGATGTYILATPTSASMDDEFSGVWFLNGADMSAGLHLPELPSTWAYEGWAVINGTPISTGTFTSVSGMDMSSVFSGLDNPGPPYPGEDFIMNAPSGVSFPTDLRNAAIVISIEPVPDNSPAPFAFKPLIDMVPGSAMDHTNYTMDNQVATNFPVGTVSR